MKSFASWGVSPPTRNSPLADAFHEPYGPKFLYKHARLRTCPMRGLIYLAFAKRQRLGLVWAAGFAMVLSTLASQAEMLSVRLLNPQSVDAFELFNQNRGKDQHLSHREIERNWQRIDPSGQGYITREGATRYLAEQREKTNTSPLVRLRGYLHLERGFSRLIALLLGIGLFKVLSGCFLNYMTGLIQLKLCRDLSQSTFDHLQSLPMRYHQEHPLGEMVTRISQDASMAASAVNSLLFNYWQTPILVISSLVYLYWMSPGLFLVVFIELPILALFIFLIMRRFKALSFQTLHQKEEGTSLLVDLLSGIQSIKLFAVEQFASQRFERVNAHLTRLELRELRYRLFLRPVVHFACSIFFVGVIFWGVQVAQIEWGDLIGYCGLIYLIYEQVKKIAEQNALIQRGAVAADRLLKVFHAHSEIRDAPNAITMPLFGERIEFAGVWFRYRKEGPWVLRDLSFTVRKGGFCAIVGPTGAGKSSLIKLLARLYDVDKGKVSLDGLELCQLTQVSLRNQIAYVPQHPFFLRGTIAENIAFGREIDLKEIIFACEKARAHQFIKDLPAGYDEMLAEGGKNFSGGQLQRLAIARALARRAPILILDEATSALDALTEAQIRQTLGELRGQLTLIVIAHRLSTIEDADEILYLDGGELMARGKQRDLMHTCAPFHKMWQAMQLSSQPTA